MEWVTWSRIRTMKKKIGTAKKLEAYKWMVPLRPARRPEAYGLSLLQASRDGKKFYSLLINTAVVEFQKAWYYPMSCENQTWTVVTKTPRSWYCRMCYNNLIWTMAAKTLTAQRVLSALWKPQLLNLSYMAAVKPQLLDLIWQIKYWAIFR